jgi:hypothetical protein
MLQNYGAVETNPLDDEHKAIRERISGTVDLTDPKLVRITRLRLVSDPGFPLWDLSYCYGRLADGSDVRVDLPQFQFSKRYLSRDLLAMCKSAGRYAKGLGFFDPLVVSKFYG